MLMTSWNAAFCDLLFLCISFWESASFEDEFCRRSMAKWSEAAQLAVNSSGRLNCRWKLGFLTLNNSQLCTISISWFYRGASIVHGDYIWPLPNLLNCISPQLTTPFKFDRISVNFDHFTWKLVNYLGIFCILRPGSIDSVSSHSKNEPNLEIDLILTHLDPFLMKMNEKCRKMLLFDTMPNRFSFVRFEKWAQLEN